MDRKQILNDVAKEMMELYSNLKDNNIARESADSLANVAGKALKAVQLDIANEYLIEEQSKRISAPQPMALAA